MNAKHLATLALLICLALFPEFAAAQGGPPPGGPPRHGGPPPILEEMELTEEQEKRLEKARESLATVYLFKVQQHLELEKERALELFAVLEEGRDKLQPLQRELRVTGRAIKLEVDKETPDEDLVKQLTEKALTLRSQIHQLELEGFSKLDSILTPVEKAKYLLFHEGFKRRMSGMLARFLQDGQMPPGMGPGGEGPPDRRALRERFRRRLRGE